MTASKSGQKRVLVSLTVTSIVHSIASHPLEVSFISTSLQNTYDVNTQYRHKFTLALAFLQLHF